MSLCTTARAPRVALKLSIVNFNATSPTFRNIQQPAENAQLSTFIRMTRTVVVMVPKTTLASELVRHSFSDGVTKQATFAHCSM
jgi:hypothetical protein